MPRLSRIQVLKLAKEVTRKRWGRGNYATNHRGIMTDTTSLDACRFCAVGSLYRVLGISVYEKSPVVNSCVILLNEASGINNILAFNDDRAKNRFDVIKVFDRAIRKLTKKKRKVSV